MSDCQECAAMERTLMDVRIELQDSEAERKRLLRRTKTLEQELSPRRASKTEDLKAADELFELWLAPRAARPGRAPAYTEDRLKALLWGIKHYQRDGAEAAIRSSFKFPFLVFGKWSPTSRDEKDRKDDLTDIFGVAKRTEALIRLHDGEDDIPAPALAPEGLNPGQEATRLHNVNNGWTPLLRAVGALQREGGWDTVSREFDEVTLFSENPVKRWHSWCPCHPFEFVGLRLWEGEDRRVRAECDGACAEKAILKAIFALEDKQVERAKALIAFDRVANPQTLDKVVKALEIRAGESRYSVARKMGIHDNADLGLTVDPRTLKWAA